ncbi:hypothetical protein M0811_07465 [Anaeramoeba ignava]|uniref:Uncharacterized protein n=1 Tax=Anaeramoeba ignava TaxID=1746090 RepID=A0A9Q0RCG8_ANAIG|nr:hypothetical protein M0811_07465 [Anaeramoeba ignava]
MEIPSQPHHFHSDTILNPFPNFSFHSNKENFEVSPFENTFHSMKENFDISHLEKQEKQQKNLNQQENNKKKRYQENKQDKNTMLIILDYAVNIQEYRGRWSIPDFYDAKAWSLLNGTLLFGEKRWYIDLKQDLVQSGLEILEGIIKELIEQKEFEPPPRLAIYSDGPRQFKSNSYILFLATRMRKIFQKVEIYTFVAYHGKSACDMHFGSIAKNKKSYGDITSVKDLQNYLGSCLKNTQCKILYPRKGSFKVIQRIPDLRKFHLIRRYNDSLWYEEKLPTQEETQKLKKKNPTKKRRKTDSISPKSISQPISKDPLITRRKYNLRKKQAPERFQKFQVS